MPERARELGLRHRTKIDFLTRDDRPESLHVPVAHAVVETAEEP